MKTVSPSRWSQVTQRSTRNRARAFKPVVQPQISTKAGTRSSRNQGSATEGHVSRLFPALPSIITLLALPWLVSLELGDRETAVAAVLITGTCISLSYLLASVYYRGNNAKVDIFQPMGFPLFYLAGSFLLPPAYAFAMHDNRLGFPLRDGPLICWIMCAGACAATAGSAFGLGVLKQKRRIKPAQQLNGKRLLLIGRVALLIVFYIHYAKVAAGGVLIRGLGQGVYTVGDVLSSSAIIFTPIAPLAILIGQHSLGRRRTLQPVDWALVGLVILVAGLSGNRGAVIGLIVTLGMWGARYGFHRVAPLRMAGLVAVGLTFAVAVLRYRASVQGDIYVRTRSRTELILGDLSVAASTTMGTKSGIESGFPLLHGRTFLEELLRLLPSPIAVGLFGPPTNTGTLKYREMIGLDDPRRGVGYSLPAEGWLNFGLFGLILVCFAIGFIVSRAQMFSFGEPWQARSYFYFIVVTSLPFGLRSDGLGLSKAIIYGAIFIFFVVRVSRRKGPSAQSRSRENKLRPRDRNETTRGARQLA